MKTNLATTFFMFATMLLVATFFGLAVGLFDIFFSLFVVFAFFVVFTFIKHEELFFIGYLCFSFFTPSYPLIDVVTVLYVLYYVMVLNSRNMISASIIKKLPAALWIYLAFVSVWTLISILAFNNEYKFIYRDARVFLYYLLVIPMYSIFFSKENFSKNEDKVFRLARATLVFSITIAVITIIQVLMGVKLVQTGVVADLNNISSAKIEVMRVQIPGFPFVMFAITLATSAIFSRAVRWQVYSLCLFILFCGLIFNYGRGLWLWTFCSLMILSFTYGVRQFIKVAFIAIAVVLLLVIITDYFELHILNSVIERVMSVAAEGGGSTSLGWRQFEVYLGLDKLVETYFLGVGVGGEYRPPLRSLAKWVDYTRYTHNTYLFITLKLSLIGLVLYFFVLHSIIKSASSQSNGYYNWQSIFKKAVFSFMIAFIGLSVTQPEVMTHYGVTLIACCLSGVFFSSRKNQCA